MIKRPYSLRTWILAGIVALVIVPYLATMLVVVVMITFFEPPETERPPLDFRSPAMTELVRSVETQHDRWADPAWQQELEQKLAPLRLRVKLADPSDTEIYESPKLLLDRRRTDFLIGYRETWTYYPGELQRSVVVYQGTSLVGQVKWYEGDNPRTVEKMRFNDFMDIFMSFAIGVIIILTVWGAVRLASRAVLRPLGALSGAARQINQGNLDFTVPASPVKEVNEFAQAFDQMRAGLRESVQKQAELEQERKLFISAIAHDLRTPLSSVRGYLEGLRDGVANTEEKRQRYVSVALEKTGTLEHLIESLFAYTKAEYLAGSMQREELELGALLREAAEAFQPAARSKGIHLEFDEAPDPCRVNGDRHMLSRVVSNLLDNALRYTPEGGTVTLGWRGGLEHVRFWVADTGPGIPPEDLGRVFQPLYRGDKARGSRTGGAGLGLAITTRLVEAHRGKVTAENKDGTVITVTLPL